jgi:hypothetical protein
MPVSDTSRKNLAEYFWEQEYEGRQLPVSGQMLTWKDIGVI